MNTKNKGYKAFMGRLTNGDAADKIKDGFIEIAEDIMEAAGFSEQEDGPLAPAGKAGNKELYPPYFSTLSDGETVEEMAGYYSRAAADGMVAIKTLLDDENNLLCAVISKGIGGTSYYYERDDKGRPEQVCSPITVVDLAMNIMDIQKENTLISWGALTADFRMLYQTGIAEDEWASIASNHLDMLYQLRTEVGSKINLQPACLSMGIIAVEMKARSFRIEEAIKTWKTGSSKDRNALLDSMRAYCKLLLTLYGAVAERGAFLLKTKDTHMIEYAPNSYPVSWGKVWEVHRNKWENTEYSRTAKNSETYVGVNVMHNWLEEHAVRNKKTLRQVASSSSTLTDLLSRT